MRFTSQRKRALSLFGSTQRIWQHYQGGFLFISIAGAFVGATLLFVAGDFISHTNTTEFCITCHEMEATVYQEFKKTVHYSNPSGVRVSCGDCHVPKGAMAVFIRKMGAVKDIYGHLVGVIDTPEKFEAKRLEMAEQVWNYMESTNSRECRSCHSFEAMKLEQQRRRPQRKHPAAMENGDTCIDCHKGIAHKLPAGFDRDDD